MRLVFATLIFVLSATLAQAAGKVALVIGNGAYANMPVLKNPVNDASDMSAKLQEMGYTVIGGQDLDFATMGQKIGEFEEAARSADVTLFFFAGHGVQVNGLNYLIPVNSKLERESALQFEAIQADTILAAMSGPGKSAVAFLDACRNNPLSRGLRGFAKSRSTSVGQGLAVPSVSGGGMLIGFATNPGNVAQDGEGRNSPFTTALLKHIGTPGLEVQQMMTRVKAEVYSVTKEDQEPWHNTSLRNEVYLNGEAALPKEPAVDPVAAQWNAIKDTDNPKILETFIAENRQNAVYVLLAEERMAQISEKSAPVNVGKLSDLKVAPLKTDEELPPLDALTKNQKPTGEVRSGSAGLNKFFEFAKQANDGNGIFALLNIGVRIVDLKPPAKNPGSKSQAFDLQELTSASGIDELRQTTSGLAYDPATSMTCRLDYIDRCPWFPADSAKMLADTMAAAGTDMYVHESNYYTLTPLRGSGDYILANSPPFGEGQPAIVAAIVTPQLDIRQIYGFDLSVRALGVEAGDPLSTIEITGAVLNGNDLYVSYDSSQRCTDKPRKFGFVAKFAASNGKLKWVSAANVSDANLILTDGKLFTASGGSCIDDYFYMLNPADGKILSRAKMPSAIERMDLNNGQLVMELYDRAGTYAIP